MAPRIDYNAVSRIEFTDQDIADVVAAADTAGFRDGRALATLNLANFPFEEADPAVLTEFAKLGTVLKRPVSKTYAGLEIKRELSDAENRDTALDALRYGYGNTAKRIRGERAAQQGIEIFHPEDETAS